MTKRENALLAYHHKTPAYIPSFYTDIDMVQAYPQGERYAGHEKGTDWFGVEWTYEPHIHAPMPTTGQYMFEDIADWEKYVKFPDLDAIDWKKQADIDCRTDFSAFVAGAGLVPYPDGHSIADDEEKLKLCMVLNGMFERLHAFMGFENALMSLLTDPEACESYFSAMADFKIRYFEKIAKYYKIDVLNAHDDYGSNDRMFMSLDTWRQLIKPHLARMVDACHDLGMLYQHHSCGYIEPLIPEFVDIGVDALDTLQACNTNIGQLKKEYGDRLTFCGGFDNMHVLDVPGISPEKVKQEYHRVIDLLAPGGSYVIFPIGATFDFVPAFLEEHFQYGMGFYQTHA